MKWRFMEMGGIAPRVPNLCITLRWVLNVTYKPLLHPQKKLDALEKTKICCPLAESKR
jgi:hypothetical protein